MLGENGFTVLGILLVLFLILVGAYYTTRFVGSRVYQVPSMKGSNQKLSLMHRLPLGKEQYLAVIQFGDRHLLVGCTQTSITLLTEMSEEESKQFTCEESSSELPSFSNFLEVFTKEKKSGKTSK